MIGFCKNILQLMLAPTRGWEDVAQTQSDARQMATNYMFPLFGLAAVTVFIQLIYHPDLSVADLLIRAATIFVSYVVGYFLSDMVCQYYLPDYVDYEMAQKRRGILIVYAQSMLAMATIVCNVIPVSLGLPFLLPLAVTLIMWKSGAYMHVKSDKETNYSVFILLAVILPPVLLQILVEEFV